MTRGARARRNVILLLSVAGLATATASAAHACVPGEIFSKRGKATQALVKKQTAAALARIEH